MISRGGAPAHRISASGGTTGTGGIAAGSVLLRRVESRIAMGNCRGLENAALQRDASGRIAICQSMTGNRTCTNLIQSNDAVENRICVLSGSSIPVQWVAIPTIRVPWFSAESAAETTHVIAPKEK
jgi:hypothetical protein